MRGFTLIELVVVLAIVSVLVTIGGLSYQRYLEKARYPINLGAINRTKMAQGILGTLEVFQNEYTDPLGTTSRWHPGLDWDENSVVNSTDLSSAVLFFVNPCQPLFTNHARHINLNFADVYLDHVELACRTQADDPNPILRDCDVTGDGILTTADYLHVKSFIYYTFRNCGLTWKDLH